MDRLNRLQKTDPSRDLSQTSIDHELLTFGDSDRGSNHRSLDNTGGAIDCEMSNGLLLSLENPQCGDLGLGGLGRLSKPVAGRLVLIPWRVIKGRW